MDKQVLAAMARWPDVPDVFGWLSLNTGGHWRLHPKGDALDLKAGADQYSEGEPITSPSINRFINRNYARDTIGRWYFQNGPQRVFVRLDVAPYIFHTTDPKLGSPVFLSHNGLRTRTVTRWCLDHKGHLYADTEHGAGLVAGRDLGSVMDKLTTNQGENLFTVLDRLDSSVLSSVDVRWDQGLAVPLYMGHFDRIADLLGFTRFPRPE